MILPLPTFMRIPPAATEEGRARQDRRMTRDMAIMALATVVLVGGLLAFLTGPLAAATTIGGVTVLSVVGALAMERWNVSASSVVLSAMGLATATFTAFACLAMPGGMSAGGTPGPDGPAPTRADPDAPRRMTQTPAHPDGE